MNALLKRFSIVLLLALTFFLVGCGKKVTPAPAPAPPPPPPPPPAPTVTLTATPTTITAGQSVTLNYASSNATSVSIDPGVGTVQPATGGTRQVSPTSTTTYRATASGPGGTAQSATVNVTVAAAAPPPPPPPVVPPPNKPAPTVDEIFKQTMGDIIFDYDKYAIRTDMESRLLNIASWLKQNPTVRFRIEGNADERGSQEYNIALGDERASSVMKYLSVQGVPESRMTTVSYGEERPVCRDQTEDCFQKNRRAAFVRVP